MITLFERSGRPLGVPLTTVNLVGLGLLLWGVSSEVALGSGADGIVALVAVVAAAGAWVGRLSLGTRSPAARPLTVCLVILALSGGVVTAFAPLGAVFLAVAALVACIHLALTSAVLIEGAGLAAVALSAPFSGRSLVVLVGAVAAACAGLAIGASRRQTIEDAAAEARLELEVQRAEVERARAEILAERNRLARDIHDVLAHTLSALSLQLEAFGAVLASEGTPSPDVAARFDAVRRLLRDGLDEARQAVRALRDDAPSLPDQLKTLCAAQHADLSITGTVRDIRPEAARALYRVAQEALTNVVKHAPGVSASVDLALGERDVTLVVANPPATRPPGPLAASGGGYGLQGMRERILLLGGRVEAGATGEGWRVVAWLPV